MPFIYWMFKLTVVYSWSAIFFIGKDVPIHAAAWMHVKCIPLTDSRQTQKGTYYITLK